MPDSSPNDAAPPPGSDTDPLLMLLQRLTTAGVEYVVIGGFAAMSHGSPVVTQDVDVCAPLHLENLRKIVEALRDLHPCFRMHPNRPPLREPERMVGFRNLNLITDWGQLDILGDVPKVASYEEIAGKSLTFHFGKFACQVIDLDSLIAAKKAAARDKDKMNLWHLEVIRKKHQQQPGLFDKPT